MPLDKVTKLAVIGAAGAYLYLRSQDEPAPTVPTESMQQRINRISMTPWARAAGSTSGTPNPVSVTRSVFDPNGDWAQEVIDAVIARLKAKWDSLSAELRKQACESLKEQFPEDPGVQAMNCANTDFNKLVNVVGVASASIACGPGAPGCAAVAIICLAVFGEDIGTWLQDAWDKFAYRQGIGGPFEEHYWRAHCQAAVDGNDESLLKILTSPDDALGFCIEEGYSIGVRV